MQSQNVEAVTMYQEYPRVAHAGTESKIRTPPAQDYDGKRSVAASFALTEALKHFVLEGRYYSPAL